MQAKFFGTAVTKENFLEWRERFEAEMKLNVPKSSNQTGRLTGVLSELLIFLYDEKLSPSLPEHGR